MATPVTDPQPYAGSLVSGEQPGQAVLLPSAARTTAQTVVFAPGDDRGIVAVTIKVATSSGFGLTPSIEFWDAASGTWIALLTGTKITGASTVTLSVGPHALVTTNVSQTCALAPLLRFSAAVDDTTSVTYSVGVRAS